MKCCINCFNDSFLKDFIIKRNVIDNCDYCDSQDVFCINVQALSILFDPLIKLYDPVVDFMPLEDLKNLDVLSESNLWELLQNRWDIFSSEDSEVHENLLRDMYKEFDASEPEKYLFDELWRDADEYWGIDVEYSDQLKDLWQKFTEDLIFKNRFFPESEIDLQSIENQLPYLANKDFKAGIKLFRSRKCLDDELYSCDEMGKPPNKKALAGRANPKGISYLYLGSDDYTVISEIRPTFNDLVTVAQFLINSDLNLIDLRKIWVESPFKLGPKLGDFLMNLAFLRLLGHELTKPVSSTDSEMEYLPSQYICEFIKLKKYDGILYNSVTNKEGFNLVLFSDHKVKCINSKLVRIKNTLFEFEDVIK